MLLLGCSDGGDRTVVVQTNCVEELPGYVAGTYWMMSWSVDGVVRQPAYRGRLMLEADRGFLLKVGLSGNLLVVEGFHDVRSGLLVIFRDGEFGDVVAVYDYDYSRDRLTLRWYDVVTGRRHEVVWKKLPNEY